MFCYFFLFFLNKKIVLLLKLYDKFYKIGICKYCEVVDLISMCILINLLIFVVLLLIVKIIVVKGKF